MSTSTTGISWTGRTWNPVRGCAPVSPGCKNCYAQDVAYRFCKPGMPFAGLVELRSGRAAWTGAARFVPDALTAPLSWTKPTLIFVDSMSDLFYEGFTDEQIDQVYAVMLLAHWHRFQVLTKRIERAHQYLSDPQLYRRVLRQVDRIRLTAPIPRRRRQALYQVGVSDPSRFPAPWIWLLASVEDQPRADERLDWLVKCPAGVRGVSYEPALERVDFRRWLPHLDWLIVGGESGPRARPCDEAWVASARDQADQYGVPLFVKQFGDLPVLDETIWRAEPGTRLLSAARKAHRAPPGTVALQYLAKGAAVPSEWPVALRRQEWPRVPGACLNPDALEAA